MITVLQPSALLKDDISVMGRFIQLTPSLMTAFPAKLKIQQAT
jgi:hypothetical protein